MKEVLRRRALELGFDDCRVTSAAAPAGVTQYQNWLEEKRHGEMNWLERTAAKRLEPQRVLSGAKSIISLAANYGSNVERREPEAGEFKRHDATHPSTLDPRPSTGLIARYARTDDYHNVLAAPLKELAAFVNQLGGTETRSLWYVDTGPLLERDFAQRAGLGFIGKHTNVISRKFGNWILLAEIITTLELEPDPPDHNHCGKCTRCLAACPTNAITAPFQLDARHCISYLTIELKGSIPVELRPAIGNRIFGCDDCLAVCPWNRFAHEGNLMKSRARPGSESPDLIQLLQLDEAGFKSRFAGTPILRAKRRGLLRNVCVALGNVGGASALRHLQKASAEPEPLIAEHARWAIEQIESRL